MDNQMIKAQNDKMGCGVASGSEEFYSASVVASSMVGLLNPQPKNMSLLIEIDSDSCS